MSSASSVLSTTNITSMVDSYIEEQESKRLDPLTEKQTEYETLSSTLTKVSTYTSSLTSALRTLSKSTSSSVYNSTTATSNDEDVLTATSDKTASEGSYTLTVSQLAKSDLLLSNTATSADTDLLSNATGTSTFTITTANETSTDYSSTIEIDWDSYDGDLLDNQDYMQAIAYAINQDKAQVTSTGLDATALSNTVTEDSTITFTVGDVDDVEDEDTYTVTIASGTTYEDALDEIISQLTNDQDAEGINVTTVTNDDGTTSLQITSSSKTYYFSIADSTGTLAADLGIEATKEVAASQVMTASTYTPSSGVTQLSISADDTGLDHIISSISDDSGTALSALGLDLDSTRTEYDDTTGTSGYVYADTTEDGNLLNAKYTLNGIEMQSTSNSVEDVVEGVTFNLLSKTDTDDEVTVTIESDTDSIISSIQSFIDAFNTLYTYIKDQSAVTEDGTRGTLASDSTTSSLLNQLTSMVYDDWGEDGATIQTLSQLGISFDSETGLTLDEDDLEDALASYSEEVENLFNGTDGLATTLYESLKGYTGTDGYITQAIETYDDSAEYLDDRIDKVQDSIDSGAELLRSKYLRLQQQLTVLLATESLFS